MSQRTITSTAVRCPTSTSSGVHVGAALDERVGVRAGGRVVGNAVPVGRPGRCAERIRCREGTRRGERASRGGRSGKRIGCGPARRTDWPRRAGAAANGFAAGAGAARQRRPRRGGGVGASKLAAARPASEAAPPMPSCVRRRCDRSHFGVLEQDARPADLDLSPGWILHLLTRAPFTIVPGSLPRSISVMSSGEATSMTACMRDASSSSTRRWLFGSLPTLTMSCVTVSRRTS